MKRKLPNSGDEVERIVRQKTCNGTLWKTDLPCELENVILSFVHICGLDNVRLVSKRMSMMVKHCLAKTSDLYLNRDPTRDIERERSVMQLIRRHAKELHYIWFDPRNDTPYGTDVNVPIGWYGEWLTAVILGCKSTFRGLKALGAETPKDSHPEAHYSATVITALLNCPNLEILNATACQRLDHLLLKAIKCSKQLQELQLKNKILKKTSNSDDEDEEEDSDSDENSRPGISTVYEGKLIRETSDTVTKLSMDCTVGGAQAFFDGRCPNLCVLRLETILGQSTWPLLAAALCRLDDLRALHLGMPAPLMPGSWLSFDKALLLPNLERLELEHFVWEAPEVGVDDDNLCIPFCCPKFTTPKLKHLDYKCGDTSGLEHILATAADLQSIQIVCDYDDDGKNDAASVATSVFPRQLVTLHSFKCTAKTDADLLDLMNSGMPSLEYVSILMQQSPKPETVKTFFRKHKLLQFVELHDLTPTASLEQESKTDGTDMEMSLLTDLVLRGPIPMTWSFSAPNLLRLSVTSMTLPHSAFELLKRFPQLQEMVVNCCAHFTIGTPTDDSLYTNLNSLRITQHATKSSADDEDQLLSLLRCCSRLKRLHLWTCKMSGSAICELATFGHHHLEKLSFFVKDEPSESEVRHCFFDRALLWSLFVNCPQMNNLLLSETLAPDVCTEEVTSDLKHYKQRTVDINLV